MAHLKWLSVALHLLDSNKLAVVIVEAQIDSAKCSCANELPSRPVFGSFWGIGPHWEVVVTAYEVPYGYHPLQ